MNSFFQSIKKTSGHHNDVLQILLSLSRDKMWIELTSKKEIYKISVFLFQTKNFLALKELLLCCLKKPEKIPGDSLLYFLSFNPEIDVYNSVFMEFHNQKPIFKNYLCPYSLNPKVYDNRIKEQQQTYLKKYLKTKEDLIDKFQFAKSQRLEAEVKKTLEKLLEAFPNDPNLVDEKGIYIEKEAARVIEKSHKNLNKNSNQNLFDPQTQSYRQDSVTIYNLIKDDFNENQQELLMEMFLLSSDEDIVVHIIDQNSKLKQKYFWTYIELLVEKRRFIEALSQIKDFTVIRSSEDQFHYYYFSAICLWNLQDKSSALNIMKSIAKVKPNFKQTFFYLNLWQRHSDVA